MQTITKGPPVGGSGADRPRPLPLARRKPFGVWLWKRPKQRGVRIVKGVAHRRACGLRGRPYVPPVDNSSRGDGKGRRVVLSVQRHIENLDNCFLLRQWQAFDLLDLALQFRFRPWFRPCRLKAEQIISRNP